MGVGGDYLRLKTVQNEDLIPASSVARGGHIIEFWPVCPVAAVRTCDTLNVYFKHLHFEIVCYAALENIVSHPHSTCVIPSISVTFT